MSEKPLPQEEILGGRSSGADKDSSGNVKFTEQNAPTAEDNTNGVIAHQVKPMAATDYAYTFFSDLGANATAVVKNGEGNVFSIECHNDNAAARWFQLHNLAVAATTTSSVPVWEVLVPADSVVVIGNDFFGPGGLNFSTGITFSYSTTKNLYTAATASDQTTFVMYK